MSKGLSGVRADSRFWYQTTTQCFSESGRGAAIYGQLAFGKRYDDHISSTELATLVRMFQQRHLVAHTQGSDDQDYITRSGTTSYRVGQRVVIRKRAVYDCLALLEKLAAAIKEDTERLTKPATP